MEDINKKKSNHLTKKIIIITGATGSGKSAYAVELAKKINGVIINADSMQIYKQIPIISAQPNDTNTQNIGHYLYGFVDIFDTKNVYSVGKYLNDLKNTITHIKTNNPEKTPIIAGGTMLYIDAIINGLNIIPEIKSDVKDYVKNKYSNKNTEQIFQDLKKLDEKYANIVDKNNPQRVTRGIEVKLSTGKSIIDFWNKKEEKSIFNDYEIQKFVIDMPRNLLYDRINYRFDEMLKHEALDEVFLIYKHCLENNVDYNKLPKAIGLKEFFEFFDKKTSLEAAISSAKQHSRNYAKRQITWFRNRFKDFQKICFN